MPDPAGDQALTAVHDARLLGTWQSDRWRTGREIAARGDITAARKARLRRLFGRLVVRYTKTRCYATLDGETNVRRYIVIAKDRSSAVVILSDSVTGEPTISHIHFQEQYYWISLGPIREYFRKIA